jgi:hypothetical protein
MSGDVSSSENSPTHAGWRLIGLTALLLAALWALDLYVLRTTLLTTRKGQPPLTPLYAFFDPAWSSRAFLFVGLAAVGAWFAPRVADPTRVSRAIFVLLLAASAVALSVALFVVRQPLGDLGAQSVIFEYQDFLQDSARVGDVPTFLREYVVNMPALSLHGQHYPPGPAIFLHAIAGVFGPSPFPGGVAIVAAFAAALVVTYATLRELVGERAARQGAILILCVPTALDHAGTALDAVFMLAAACSWWCALRAFRPGASALWSLGLGALLLATTFMSFSALPVGMSITIYALVRARSGARGALSRLAIVGAVYVLGVWLLWAASGFALWDCLEHSRAHAEKFMGRIVRGTPRATWFFRSYGNIAAIVIGGGVGLMAAVLARLRAGRIGADGWTSAALVSLVVMTFGQIYYMETERIWLFVLPWLACIAVGGGAFDDRSLSRLVAVGWLQALAMEVVLFTFW